LLQGIFEVLPEGALHSVSLGAFRMPNSFYKRIERQYPEEPLFAGNFKSENGYIAYRQKTETELMEKCSKSLQQWVNPEKIFNCNI
jgi:spore photoproduct lyase